MARVRLAGIRKIYNGEHGRAHVAVHGFDLDIADGEFVVLVGPSGCGKSTVLRMIAGLEELTAGTLTIGDRVVNGVAPRDRDVAMVFQNYALYPHMTVFENLAFALELRKVPKDKVVERVREAAAMLEIDSLLERTPRQLSGGQRQRVAVGRAIVRDPAVFLFDEPLSNLDAKLRVQTRRDLARLHQRLKTTTVYVTHDQMEAMTLGDRIVVMKDGKVQQVDTPMEVYTRPANVFVAGFLGSPPMNLVRGSVVRTEGTAWFKADGADFKVDIPRSIAERLQSTALTLGFRPEAVLLEASPSSWMGRVGDVEPLGNETLVSLDVRGVPVTARVVGYRAFRPSEELPFSLDAGGLHWFGGDDDIRIG
ncbi:MAG: sn-glycerol-3-phosphate ABC transporter ATP-binding protein UgpC [Gemmatimonadota bacterium]